MNVSSLALPPSQSQSVRASQNSPPQLEKRLVTKLSTPTRKKARSQNSRPHPEKMVGHKTRGPIPKKGSDPIPKKGPVTKLETPSRKKARSHDTDDRRSGAPAASTGIAMFSGYRQTQKPCSPCKEHEPQEPQDPTTAYTHDDAFRT